MSLLRQLQTLLGVTSIQGGQKQAGVSSAEGEDTVTVTYPPITSKASSVSFIVLVECVL